MRGSIKAINRYSKYCVLIDETGIERCFTRIDICPGQKIRKHDIVEFTLCDGKVRDVTLLRKHRKGTVISFG